MHGGLYDGVYGGLCDGVYGGLDDGVYGGLCGGVYGWGVVVLVWSEWLVWWCWCGVSGWCESITIRCAKIVAK